ncbi:small integral membrane protein 30-like [Neoarius graeffei]|uniref:small integral membrane protein 30-like n=1 Tax=Neoarius graeffei TaxID=443677 RepID=UPI00298D2BDD|nr:small integral membrane protein 30-like [Neoarius graeffei]
MNNMASSWTFPGVLAVLCFFFLCVLQPVEAYDGGDAVALLLGMAITVVGFCACLGWYARRRSGQF